MPPLNRKTVSSRQSTLRDAKKVNKTSASPSYVAARGAEGFPKDRWTIHSIVVSLDAHRKMLDITVPEFCERSGMDKSNYYKLLKGSATGFTVTTLLRMLEVLELTFKFDVEGVAD